jgi:hypothetical protein
VIVDKDWKHVTQVTDRNVILVKGEVVFDGSSADCASQPHCSTSTWASRLPARRSARAATTPERRFLSAVGSHLRGLIALPSHAARRASRMAAQNDAGHEAPIARDGRTTQRDGSPTARRSASHHHRQFEVMGAHATERGTRFTVWAPNARRGRRHRQLQRWHCEPLQRMDDGSGRWSGFIAGARPASATSTASRTRRPLDGQGGPYAFRMEHPPGTASQIWDLAHEWGDQMDAHRWQRQSHRAPISIYEVHLGSWQREEDGASSTTATSRSAWPCTATTWASRTWS